MPRAVRCAAVAGCAALLAHAAPAQNPPAATDQPVATLHGVVRNAATGEGLPRALVEVEGDAAAGTLTDGEGRFAIPGIPVGPQVVQVVKPGFRDAYTGAGAMNVRMLDAAPASAQVAVGPPHNIVVAAAMPDVVFTLAPTRVIRGRIDLSTGDPAEGIEVELLQRVVQDGRGVWQAAGVAKTRSDGSYRFGGLTAGAYVVYTDPAMQSVAATDLVEPGRAGAVEQSGYPSTFYADAQGLRGAAQIRVGIGQEADANLTLTLQPFHAVLAHILGAPATGASNSMTLTDSDGNELPYPVRFDPATGTAQTLLPDGSYTLLVSSRSFQGRRGGPGDASAGTLAGSVDFAVAGHPVTNLRISLGPVQPTPIQLIVQHSDAAQAQDSGNPTSGNPTVVLLSRASGWLGSGMVSLYADGNTAGPMQTLYTPPGAYWVHTHIQRRGLCEAAFTAGGVSLAREPLLLGPLGITAPAELDLRDDCSTLTLSLPTAGLPPASGEEPFYTVYAVPDFDTTADVEPVTLRVSTGGTATLRNLTPGSYHVYTFTGPMQLEYRNPAVLAALSAHSQAVTVQPGEAAHLTVETPQP